MSPETSYPKKRFAGKVEKEEGAWGGTEWRAPDDADGLGGVDQ
jgi:hypothetical protein